MGKLTIQQQKSGVIALSTAQTKAFLQEELQHPQVTLQLDHVS
ncbi:MAG: hypothetical protein ACH34X_15765 [Thiolinea sp.]